MTTKTRRELVNQALADLFIVEAGEIPSAADYSTVDGFVDGLLDRLQRRRIVYVDDASSIDAAIFDPLAVLLADAAKAEYGGATFDVAKAESDLRQITSAGQTDEPVRAEYF